MMSINLTSTASSVSMSSVDLVADEQQVESIAADEHEVETVVEDEQQVETVVADEQEEPTLWSRIGLALAESNVEVSENTIHKLQSSCMDLIVKLEDKIKANIERLDYFVYLRIRERRDIKRPGHHFANGYAHFKGLLDRQSEVEQEIYTANQKLEYIWQTANQMYALEKTMVTSTGFIEVYKTEDSPNGLLAGVSSRYFMKKWYVINGKTYHTHQIVNVKLHGAHDIPFQEALDNLQGRERIYDNIDSAKEEFLKNNEPLELAHRCNPDIKEAKPCKPRNMSNLSTSDISYESFETQGPGRTLYEFKKVLSIDGVACTITTYYTVNETIDHAGECVVDIKSDDGHILKTIYSIASARKSFETLLQDASSIRCLEMDNIYKCDTVQELVDRKFSSHHTTYKH